MPRDILGGRVRQDELPDVARFDRPASHPALGAPPATPGPEPAPGLLGPAFDLLGEAGRSLALLRRTSVAAGEAVATAQLQALEGWVERGRGYPGGALWADLMRAQIRLARSMVERAGRGQAPARTDESA